MFEKRIPLKTQLEALANLNLDAIEVHFDLVVRQLVAVDQIADAWRRLRHCYRTTRGQSREKQARIFVKEIFLYLKELEKLMVERFDYVDPSAAGSDIYTDQMDVELDAFESAMASFAPRPLVALNSSCPCAFAAGRHIVEIVHNRLRLAERSFDGNVEEINWHNSSKEIDFENISLDFPKWYEFRTDSYHTLLKIERARAVRFLIAHRSKLKLEATIPRRSIAPASLSKKLIEIPIGKTGAEAFHNWVADAIGYAAPVLRRQAKEVRIDEGRKRIDLVYTNEAKDGFFHRLDQRLRIFAPFVFVECKNIRADPQNPDFDQLVGRFSDRRGHFGLLVCRAIKDRQVVTRRARDIREANRGTVIVLTGAELGSV